jgi:ribosome-associated toxin RatA of RatAB toxin-antitoxin module
MTIIDERIVEASPATCFQIAADVEHWPDILPHYRWVRFHEKRAFGDGVVEMAAWRPFPAGLKYPTWWVSEMRAAPDEPAVYYKHIDGITRGMDVKWEFNAHGAGTFIKLYHTWDGPAWPLIKGVAAGFVILPHFVSAIAQRTLAGVARAAESKAKTTS